MWIYAALTMFLAAPSFAQTADCLAPPYSAPSSPGQQRIAEVYAEIAPVLGEYLFIRESQDDSAPTICLADTLGDARGVFDAETSRILLQKGMSIGLMAAILLHEFRHVDQFQRGFCPSNEVSMQENARAVAAMEADASAISLLAAWNLRLQGRPAAWDALAAWRSQEDIAARFAQEMARTGDATKSVTFAFAQWYESDERAEAYYISSCSDFLDRQDEKKLLPNYNLLPNEFFDDLCALPSDNRYPCREPDFRSRAR